jgi:hypothetical protein
MIFTNGVIGLHSNGVYAKHGNRRRIVPNSKSPPAKEIQRQEVYNTSMSMHT